MDPELTTSLDLLGRRLALMRQLASSLEQVQSAVVRSDLCGIQGHTARQRELCQGLGQLEAEALGRSPRPSIPGESREHNHKEKEDFGILPAENAVSPAVSGEVRQRWKSLGQELAQVELRVAHLNRVYAGLLRRAQRTLQIFLRVLASSTDTYGPPKRPTVMVPSTMQEVTHV